MAVELITNEASKPVKYTGLSGDTKPIPADAVGSDRAGSIFYETDTKNTYEYNGSGFGSGWLLTHIKGAQLTADFHSEVAKGNIDGHTLVHKFGKNEDVGTSWEHISQLPFDVANFRQSAVAMRVKAGGNAADTAAGAGAREVTIQGIDSNFAELSEAVATAGASASAATTATFWRVHRAWVSAAGTYTGANTAAVTIEDSGSGADFIQITADEGQTQYAGWTVPAGKTAYLLSVHTTIDVSTTKTTDIRCFVRKEIDTVAAPMEPKRLKLEWNGMDGTFAYKPLSPEFSIPEKSDIWFEAQTSVGSSSVTVDLELLVVDD